MNSRNLEMSHETDFQALLTYSKEQGCIATLGKTAHCQHIVVEVADYPRGYCSHQ